MNKKIDKKIIIGIVVVVVIIIAIFLFSGGTEEANEGSSKSSVSSEEQKYAEFEAELTCELLGATDAEDVLSVMQKTISVMEKYGYDDEEYNRLRTKYEDDNDFKSLIASEMEKICPELIE